MSRVLVLGAGQIGTFAARALADSGASVLAADLSPAPGYFARYGPRNSNGVIAADIHNPAEICALIKKYRVNTVVLTAGLGGAECAADPDRARHYNVECAIEAGQAALRGHANRLVFLSSFAVYGRPKTGRIREERTPAPESCYGQTKAEAETGLLGLRDRGLDVRILRPSGVFGPIRLGRGSHSAQLIESLLLAGIRRVEVALEARDADADEYIYVKDVARAIALTALRDGPLQHHIYNVGSGKKTSASELAMTVRQVIPEIRLRIKPKNGNSRPMMPPLDISRLRTAFGYRAQYSLQAALEDYLKEAHFVP